MKKNLLLLIMLASVSLSYAQAEVKVYRTTEVDSKPNLKNGMYSLSMFVSKNFVFPDISNKKIRLFTSFVVEPDGSMSDIKSIHLSVADYNPVDIETIQTEEQNATLAKAYESMKVEAVRVLSLFKETWIPATVNGQTVRCLYNYPIAFNIE